jgi:C1A family cysteine protease
MPTSHALGWVRDLPDHRDHLFNLEEPVLAAHRLPASVDLTPHCPPVYDQGQLGSCTGNGISAVLEYDEILQGEGTVTPSRLQLYYDERELEGTVDQDSGAQIRDGIKCAATNGVAPESLWPYDISKFAEKPPASVYTEAAKHKAVSYQRIVPGAGAPFRTALASGRPVVFGFAVPESFEDGSWDPASDAPLPLPGPAEGFVGGHCVVAVGYRSSPTLQIRVRNSWSASWGDNGYCWFSGDWFSAGSLSEGLASDMWVVRRTT